MLTAQKIKEIALAYGADEVGIASMDRFEGAPPQMDPRKWMPNAKSMIGFGYRIFRGALRGVEEGTNFGTYSTMCYGYINQRMIPWTARQVARVLEDEGYEAMPVGYHVYGGAINTNDGKSWKNNENGYSVPVAEGTSAGTAGRQHDGTRHPLFRNDPVCRHHLAHDLQVV